jgi:hypothetical protein
MRATGPIALTRQHWLLRFSPRLRRIYLGIVFGEVDPPKVERVVLNALAK